METKTDDAWRESKRASNDEREKERGEERKTMGGIDGESKATRRGDGKRGVTPKSNGEKTERASGSKSTLLRGSPSKRQKRR